MFSHNFIKEFHQRCEQFVINPFQAFHQIFHVACRAVQFPTDHFRQRGTVRTLVEEGQDRVSALHDGAMKKSLCEWRQRHHGRTNGTRALAKYRHAIFIPAKRSDIFLHPTKAEDLVF